VKPPRIRSEELWDLEAACSGMTDPGLIMGVWIAQGLALIGNGYIKLVPRSRVSDIVTRGYESAFNSWRIVPEHIQVAGRVVIETQPNDMRILCALLHRHGPLDVSRACSRKVHFHQSRIYPVAGDVVAYHRPRHWANCGFTGCTVQLEAAPSESAQMGNPLGDAAACSGLEQPIDALD
jgi:hypothetical protein